MASPESPTEEPVTRLAPSGSSGYAQAPTTASKVAMAATFGYAGLADGDDSTTAT